MFTRYSPQLGVSTSGPRKITNGKEATFSVRVRNSGQVEASDVVVVTSDNPRREDPMKIIEEILPGVRQALTGDPDGRPDPGRCLVEPDRREAIGRALALAREGDCVLIAGKGHENYQDLGERTIPFDDRLVAREFLRLRAGESHGQAAG